MDIYNPHRHIMVLMLICIASLQNSVCTTCIIHIMSISPSNAMNFPLKMTKCAQKMPNSNYHHVQLLSFVNLFSFKNMIYERVLRIAQMFLNTSDIAMIIKNVMVIKMVE